jgi:hypothetical protein
MTETLVQLQNLAIYNLQQVINYAEKEQLTNTQEFLDFLDTINGLSVTY